ncbi:hypothetical protein Tco_0957123 [Tanacetum coccineum]
MDPRWALMCWVLNPHGLRKYPTVYANKQVNEFSVEPTSDELNSGEAEVDELGESVIPSALPCAIRRISLLYFSTLCTEHLGTLSRGKERGRPATIDFCSILSVVADEGHDDKIVHDK